MVVGRSHIHQYPSASSENYPKLGIEHGKQTIKRDCHRLMLFLMKNVLFLFFQFYFLLCSWQ